LEPYRRRTASVSSSKLPKFGIRGVSGCMRFHLRTKIG
jgi:hypothetical protein